MRSRRQCGLTLIELIIALGLVGALLVIMFSGLRVGLTAWSRSEGRTQQIDQRCWMGSIYTVLYVQGSMGRANSCTS